MGKKSITKRWLLNNMGIILMIMMVLEMILIYVVQNYYYNSAKQYLTSKLNAVTSVLSLYADDGTVNFSSEVRNMVENFSEKDRMELMAINSKGKISMTSSGFSPDAAVYMSDYEEAMKAENKYGYYVGKQDSGERIMAVTYSISSMNSEYSAVRVVVSLAEVDSAVTGFIVIFTATCIGILLLLAFTGFYFIGSIVKPVQQISEIAAKFAKGDFSVRIKHDSDDEIGDLCTAINHMADELSNADAMKNEFISSVSHELRTPLTAIRGWAETIRTERDPVIFKKGIRVITNETERLSQMVEELLDFSRMQSGHFTLQQSAMDVLAELGEAALIYAERAKIEDITMTYEEPEMLPVVYGDKNRIRQVFINIIDNAIKYTPSGSVISIRGFKKAGKAQVSVEDNGPGIPDEMKPHIFEMFYTGKTTVMDSHRSLGLGLALCHSIIEAHDGTLILTDHAPHGCNFTFTLPLSEVTLNE